MTEEKQLPKDHTYAISKKWWKVIVGSFLLVILICFIAVPVAVVKFHSGIVYDDSTANIANTIGGIAGPLVALVAVALTSLAFALQYRSNELQNKTFQLQQDATNSQIRTLELQREANVIQNLNFKIQQFENSFFELLRLYKEILQEVEINGKRGKLAFKEPNQLIRMAYNVIQEAALEVQEKKAEGNKVLKLFTREERDDFAFKIVFYGVDSLEFLNNISEFYFELGLFLWEDKPGIVEHYRTKLREKFLGEGTGIPVDYERGVRFILSPYFNHLYHSIHFVHTRDFLTPNQKQFYVEILVNQISPDEQVTLFYYSISLLGERWRELIKEYSLIKNVPFIPDFYWRSHPRRWYSEIKYANPPSYIHEGGMGFNDGDEDVNIGLFSN